MLYLVRVRNTPGEQRNTWATFAKAAREGARMSQSELARRLDMERTTIWRWETGKQRPESADVVAAFADVLDIDLDEALAAAGLRPGATALAEPTRERDEEIELVASDPDLDDAMKQRIIDMILDRRERDRASGIEDTRRVIRLFKRGA
jgi:transcriptional regulator with XRE-family HTH domain